MSESNEPVPIPAAPDPSTPSPVPDPSVAGSPVPGSAVPKHSPYMIVLGIAQDGGYPHAGCRKPCCQIAWEDRSKSRLVASVALVDPASGDRWIFDVSPDFPEQLQRLDRVAPPRDRHGVAGVFLTHAHIGHYTGLVHLGKEVMGAKRVPTYAMPRMQQFLSGSGPWSQLVELENIVLRDLVDGEAVVLNERLRVTPFLVPHRGEFSETVGFRIDGPDRSAVFLPDIDKWDVWETPIESVVAKVDVALLDGTFFDGAELPGREIAKIPHPFVVESLERFASLSASEKAKVRFTHLNHTNPVMQIGSPERARVETAGFGVADEGDVYAL